MRYKIAILFLFIFFVMMKSQAQKLHPVSVTFRLTSTALPEDSSVFITGNIEPLGEWNPGKTKMNYEGNHVWRIRINIDKPVSIEYKYTLGNWEHEGAKTDGTPLANLSANLQHDTTINDTIGEWTKNTQNQTTEHRITGVVKYYLAMKGKGIKDRDVAVWLPPNYDSSGKTRYPVLYMQDGQNVFDPATSAFGVEWSVDETCDSLIKAGTISPLIVVGIYNTKDRSFEYAPGTKGEAYMNFMVKKVKPFIDSTYATNKEKEHTFVGGSSLGGLISFMLAWQYPDVFSKAICFSPAFKINKLDYVKNVTSYKGKKKEISFYIANGGVGLDAQLQPGVNAMLSALQKKGYEEGKEVKYVNDIKAAHSEASWAKVFPDAIVWCMEGK